MTPGPTRQGSAPPGGPPVADRPASDRRFEAAEVVRVVLIVVGLVLLVLFAWRLANVLLLAFAAVLFAIVLQTLSRRVQRWTPLGPRSGLVIAIVLVAGLVAAFVYLIGAQLRAELQDLLQTLPSAARAVGERFGVEQLDEHLLDEAERFFARTGVVSQVWSYGTAMLTVLGALALVAAAGIFLAARPEVYRRGVLTLVPRRVRPEAARAFDNVGHALERWLLGQGIAMLIIGSITTVGLYLLGVPSAFALGFLAGLAAFVPILGPIVSVVPAIVIAVPEGVGMAVGVLLLYAGVQTIESNVITPLVQRKMVDLPPVLLLFAVLALTILFGPLGILLGTPLTVALLVAVKQLYVQDTLHEQTTIPGEPAPDGGDES